MSNGSISATAKERTLYNSLIHLRSKARDTRSRIIDLESRVFGVIPKGAETAAPDQEEPSLMDLVNNTHDVLDSLSDYLLKLEQTL